MVWYLDTSAFLKLVVAEPESTALQAWLAEHGPIWSSQLLRTEALRAGSRLGIDETAVEEALEATSLVRPAASTFLVAGTLAPASLGSLEALHLATALELGEDLEGVITYDDRMARAAEASDVAAVSPA